MALAGRLFPGEIAFDVQIQEMAHRRFVMLIATSLSRILSVQNIRAEPDGFGPRLLDGQDAVRPKRHAAHPPAHPLLEHEGFRLRRDAERKPGHALIPHKDLAGRRKRRGVDEAFGKFRHEDLCRRYVDRTQRIRSGSMGCDGRRLAYKSSI